jgi:hypothetical protein
MGSLMEKNKLAYFFHMRLSILSPIEIIGTPAMRAFKRYIMPFSVYPVSRTTLSSVEREWVVISLQGLGKFFVS